MTSGVVAALISSGVLLLVSLATQVETWRRSRAERGYDRRRSALIDVQDAALVLRDAVRGYGEAVARSTGLVSRLEADRPDPDGQVLTPGPSSEPVERARGRVEVCAVRLEVSRPSTAVDDALRAWVTAADEHFISPSDVTAGAEQGAWSAFNRAVGVALLR